jgi:hypothetical protein
MIFTLCEEKLLHNPEKSDGTFSHLELIEVQVPVRSLLCVEYAAN